MTALSRHMAKYSHARPSTLRQKVKQDETTEALRLEVRRMRFHRQYERLKSALRWPPHVWRW